MSSVPKQSKCLRIGVNCLQVDPSSVGGVNTYTLGLLEGFANASEKHQFCIFATPQNHHLFHGIANQHNVQLMTVSRSAWGVSRQACRAVLLSQSTKIYRFTSDFIFKNARQMMDTESDVVYTPTTVLQWFNARKPTVLSLHDIQQVHHPEFFSWSRRLSRRIVYGLSARYASFVQASSSFIKEDLLRNFPELSPDQVEVIPSGVNISTFASAANSDEVRKRYGLPDRFLFFPAQLWPHKNHLTVLKALKQIEERTKIKIPLVLTGAAFTEASKIFAFIANHSMNYVKYLGKVSPEDMVALYQSAAFMITATLHESSSLPILEAAAAGTPVIASRIPPLEELAQVLDLNLFDPLNVNELADLIVALWNDNRTASAQAQTNRRQIRQFSWENTARKYIQLFEKIVSSSPVGTEYVAGELAKIM